MANINTHNVSKAEIALLRSYDSLIDFGKLFLPGDFLKSETPNFHYEIATELNSPSNKPCAIILARGHAKTTLVKAKILKDLCFAKKAYEWGFSDIERFEFFGWVSSNQKKSKNNVAYIKLNLQQNQEMIYYFGKKMVDGSTMLKGDTWNQENLVTAWGDRLISSSNLSSMRGDTLATLEQGAVRYSCVFIDDAENEENTKTSSARESIVNNIMDGIMPAIDSHYPGNRLFLIETPVHYDAMAQDILDRWAQVRGGTPEEIEAFPWKVIAYGATQPHMPGGVLWHSWMPREALDAEKQRYIHSKKGVAGYYQEYEIEVQSKDNSIWTREHIKFWDGYYRWDEKIGQGFLHIGGIDYPVNVFIGCDPATDIDTRESDFTVVMAVAIDSDNNSYVLEYERHRAIPTVAQRDKDGEILGKKGVVDYIMDMHEKYHAMSSTVEDVAMNRSVFQSLNERRRLTNKFHLSVIPEKPGGREKRNRILSGLAGRFSGGTVYYRENMFDLINETVTFGPRMAHDDTIEAFYYACRYAYPPEFIKKEVGTEGAFEFEKPATRRAKPWQEG